jgi:hypothetical protein
MVDYIRDLRQAKWGSGGQTAPQLTAVAASVSRISGPPGHPSASRPRRPCQGGGFEWKFAPQWSVKAEYLFYDLGRATYNGVLVAACTGCGVPFFTNNVQTTTRFDGNIIRVGLNYQFH